MDPQQLTRELKASKEFFDRSSRCLEEQHAQFTPAEGVFTTAQVIAHIGQTVDWFREGAFGEGFDMDFQAHEAEVRKVQSLAEARECVDRAYTTLIDMIASKSAEEMMVPLPDGPIMGGVPRMAIVGAISDHTAHHRGALSIYSRLCGLVPAMPYMET